MSNFWVMIRKGIHCQKEQSEAVAETAVFTYCQASHHAGSKEWEEKDRPPQVLRYVYSPPQSRRPGVGAILSGWFPLHRRVPLPLLGRYRFHALAQIPAHPGGEVDPSKKLALQLRWPHPLLGCDFRPLRCEALVEEAGSLSQLSPHRGQPPFRPAGVFSPLVSA